MEFCDLNRQYNAYRQEIDDAIQGVINRSAFINGPDIGLLEADLSAYTGSGNVLSCASGTDALMLLMMAFGIGPGDEVICPAFSYIASASMVSLLNAKPVFVDVTDDYNIDVDQIEDKITPRTKGIIAVSLFGRCAQLEAINTIARRHGLWVVEDGAQSFGADCHGRKSCTLTDAAITSFFPAKPLGCYGDGGAIFTNDNGLAGTLKILRAQGQERRYIHKHIGINGRMDTLQAAIVRVKLKHFDKELATRRQAASLYSDLLAGVVDIPPPPAGQSPTWAQYTIRTRQRDELRTFLKERGIPTAVHYPLPLPRQEAFDKDVDKQESFPVADRLSQTVLSLPMHGFITDSEVRQVAEAIREWSRNHD